MLRLEDSRTQALPVVSFGSWKGCGWVGASGAEEHTNWEMVGRVLASTSLSLPSWMFSCTISPAKGFSF